MSMLHGGQGHAACWAILRGQPVLGALCSPWRSVLGAGGPGEVSLSGCRAGC